MDRSSRQKINKETQALKDKIDQTDLIDIYLILIYLIDFIQKQQITLSSQVHTEHSPGQMTSWITNQTSVNLRKLKSYQASFLTTML